MDSRDAEQEKRRFAELYAGMADGELESIARESDSLTDEARQALEEEINRRPKIPASATVDTDEGHHVTEWDDLVIVRQFRDLPEAQLAKGLLESAQISSFLVDDVTIRMDWFISNLLGGVKLCVREKDADAAVDVLEQSIPADFEVEGVGAYEQPRCPACQSLNISFESIHKPLAYISASAGIPFPFPRRRWKCDSCGRTWHEDGPPSSSD
jgi:Putative prokaryotic signal transducing protein